ncbi:potassium uptake protein B [Mycoplasma crocodyli MP145]|uniref:Potassium uptake protein B n=2 Tax=Mycoplasma TaxID=2093 RepID=D5E5E6_MYCCM|nr:potassium uptake protein B [Mycoplasma crocodyli MP145]
MKRKLRDSFIYKIYYKMKNWRQNVSKIKYILLIYFIVVIISSLFLWSPWTQNTTFEMNGSIEKIDRISYIGALFTTSSAFSDTGLVVVDTFKHWNMFGQAIIAILILLGGIGIFTIKIFIINWILRKKSISLSEINLVNTERGGIKINETAKLVITSVKFLLFCILLFGLLLSFYFYYVPPQTTEGIKEYINNNYISPYNNWSLSFRYGFFHVISAINNAGFDIIGGNSLMPYYLNYGIQIIFILLLVIGGLGFPTLYDISNFIIHKITRKKTKYHFSLFTKMSLICYIGVLIFIFLFSFIFEITSTNQESFWNLVYIPKDDRLLNTFDLNNPVLKPYVDLGQMYGSTGSKLFALLFSSFSTRSAGFTTIDMWNLSPGTIATFTMAMFIGAAPSSTGGGIRTTTFAIIIMSLVNRMLGRKEVVAFKRTINKNTVKMAFQVTLISISLLMIISLISVSSFDIHGGSINSYYSVDKYIGMRNYGIEHIMFEVSSAFGTTGLSTGLTKELNTASIIVILLLMFIGQFGVSSTLLVWGRKKNYFNRYSYIEDDLVIG